MPLGIQARYLAPSLIRGQQGLLFAKYAGQASKVACHVFQKLVRSERHIKCQHILAFEKGICGYNRIGLVNTEWGAFTSQRRLLSSSHRDIEDVIISENDSEEDEILVTGPDAPKPIEITKDESTGIKKVVLPPISKEQQQALGILLEGRQNIIINAVAGSGKTTTLLQMAANINKPFLALLYNRKLRAETIERAEALGLSNLVIDNYHGLAYEYYTAESSTDQGLKRIVEDNLPPIKPLPDFDYLVLDEQQDMNPIIYNFVMKLLRDASKTGANSPQLMLLGDPRQEIYQFNNADKRFLTLARDLFVGQFVENGKIEDRTWVEINQNVSFRMTSKNALFINKQLLRNSNLQIGAIKDDPDDPLPRYVICDAHSEGPLEEVRRLIEDEKVPPSEIIIMSPSLRAAGNPVRDLANQISLKMPNVQIYVPGFDEDGISERVARGKILFASYHQAKGIEREAAILFNFSGSYYDFYDRHTKPPENVGNVQYVAATRAKKHLILVHHFTENYLPFINRNTLARYCDVVRYPKSCKVRYSRTAEEQAKIKELKWRWKVTDLTRNVPESVISSCFAELDLVMLSEPQRYRANPETEIEIEEGVWETVADITGTAVPAIFEYQLRGTCKLVRDVVEELDKEDPTGPLVLLSEKSDEYHKRLYEIEERLDEDKLTIADILYVANVACMLQSGYIAKVLAIPFDKYTWFKAADSKAAYGVLDRVLSPDGNYEINIAHSFVDVKAGERKVLARGRVDLFDFGKLWELKWTSTLRPEHILQTALYGAINRRMTIKRFYERQYEEQQPPPKDGEVRKKTKKTLNLDIDYENITDEVLQGRLDRQENLLLHVPTGQKIRVDRKIEGKRDGFIEVVKRLVSSKIEPPELAIGDKEFLKEAKKGFPSIVGKCTVPRWLSSGYWLNANESGATEGIPRP